MCLWPINDKFQIRVASRDIVVWKVQESFKTARGEEGKQLYSPYQHTIYKPGYVKRSKLEIYGGTVHEGLHTCLTRGAANSLVFRSVSSTRLTLPSVIPAGAKFIVGDYGQIASTALIVYHTLDDLQKVHGKVARAVKPERPVMFLIRSLITPVQLHTTIKPKTVIR